MESFFSVLQNNVLDAHLVQSPRVGRNVLYTATPLGKDLAGELDAHRSSHEASDERSGSVTRCDGR